jgi:hypothetical protein
MKREEIRLILFLCIFLTPVLFPTHLAGWGRKPPPEPKTVEQKIARKFGIEESIVSGLEDRGYGIEEVIKLLIVATATNKRPDEISILREEGMDWEEIARRYGIEIDTLDEESQKLLSEVGAGKQEEIIEKEPEIEPEIEKKLEEELE